MDLQRASSLELDAPEGVTYFGNTFYQLNTSEYKTSKSGGKSRLILPLTLPIFSLRTGWLRGIALASQSRELSPHH